MGDLDVRFYIWILLRRWPYLTTILVVSLAIAVAVALAMPRVYLSSAKILVESPQIPADLARSTVPINVVEQLQIIQQQITTRNGLIDLAEKLDVYRGKRAKLSDQDIVKDMRSRITFEQFILNAPQGSGATVFSVAFKANEPILAAKVSNALVDLILSRNQRERTDRAGDTLQFFDQEVARLGTDLSRVEADILKFKNENKDTLPDSLDFRRGQQISEQERLVALEREESGLRAQRSNLVATYANTGQIASGAPVTPEQQMLQDLNRALAEQSAIFSPTSPNIVALRARISALEEALHLRRSTETDPQDNKKVFSGVDLQLTEIDERLRFIEREKTSLAQSIAELTRSITATPASETVLNALERNRVNLQTQYNAAIARRAEASIGEQIERRSDGGRFSLLEPATPPQYPVSPNRRLIAAAGAAVGIGLSLGLVVLMEMLNKTIRRPAELAQVIEYQPLAVIPYVRAPGESLAKKTRREMAALSLAGVVSVSLIAISYYHASLGTTFQRLVSGPADAMAAGQKAMVEK
ncbi:GumC family protein [Rhizobium binxianense]